MRFAWNQSLQIDTKTERLDWREFEQISFGLKQKNNAMTEFYAINVVVNLWNEIFDENQMKSGKEHTHTHKRPAWEILFSEWRKWSSSLSIVRNWNRNGSTNWTEINFGILPIWFLSTADSWLDSTWMFYCRWNIYCRFSGCWHSHVSLRLSILLSLSFSCYSGLVMGCVEIETAIKTKNLTSIYRSKITINCLKQSNTVNRLMNI